MREVKTMYKLEHPCVARIVGWAIDEGRSICEIHMELAERGSLGRFLRIEHSPEFWDATRKGMMILDIVMGMTYIHSMGIIHGDLKPDNILLDGYYRAMIADFGLSRSDYAEGPPSPNLGTEGYNAPERLLVGARHTPKIDVYAFGVIVTDILGDQSAIRRGDFGALMQRLVPHCLSDNPEQRPSFLGILMDFVCAEFAILPEADPLAIRDSFSEVMARGSEDWFEMIGRD